MRIVAIVVLAFILVLIVACPVEEPEKVFRTVIIEIQNRPNNGDGAYRTSVLYRDDIGCKRAWYDLKANTDPFKVGDSVRCLKYKNSYELDLND